MAGQTAIALEEVNLLKELTITQAISFSCFFGCILWVVLF